MAITPRTRPPLLDQRLPPRRPELQQRILQPAAAPPPPPPLGPPFPFWLVPAGVLLATAIFATTHLLDHNNTTKVYQPSPWGPDPRMGSGLGLPTMAPTTEVGLHNLPKLDDNETLSLDIGSMYGDIPTLDTAERAYMDENCVLYGDKPSDASSCKPTSALEANIKFPNVAVEYVSKSYNSDEDSTTFTYNVCSLDEVESISHVTIPYLGTCCVMRAQYFGSTTVGGLDALTCTYGLSMDTGFNHEQACKIYTVTYMGNVPATSGSDSVQVAIGLGPDKFLQQNVAGADCRPPFDLSGRDGTGGSFGSMEDGFGSDGDGAEPGATETAAEGAEAGDGKPFDFENMFGPDGELLAGGEDTTSKQARETTDDDDATVDNFQAASPFPWETPDEPKNEPQGPPPPPGAAGDGKWTPKEQGPPPPVGGGGWTAGGRSYGTMYGGGAPGPGGGGGGGGGYGPPPPGGFGGYGTTGYSEAVNVQADWLPTSNTATKSEATDDCSPKGDIGYHSKSGQDEALKEIFYSNPYKCGGVVVEINLGNGDKHSASYYFEYAMDWKAILIEPNPNTFQKLETNRPSATNWNSAFCTAGELTFVEGPGSTPGKYYSSKGEGEVASVPIAKGAGSGGVKVPCISDLSSEIVSKTQHEHVDILYVAEAPGGSEAYAVLSSINFETLTMSILVLEVDSASSFYYDSINTLLTDAGYVKAEWDIKRWCPPIFGNCASNEVWLEKGYNPLPTIGAPETTANTKTRRLTSVEEESIVSNLRRRN